MCGIVGYVGERIFAKEVVEKLKKLEYRGYDSSGLGLSENGEHFVIKAVGNISKLEETVPEDLTMTCGIAHTRWATHGTPSEINAHPHSSTDGDWCIVHNGIVENYLDIKSKLHNSTKIKSDTDTAVVAELLQECEAGNMLEFIDAINGLVGSYAILAMNKLNPDTLFLARNKSPLYVAKGKSGVIVASDPICFCGFSDSYFRLENGEFAKVSLSSVEFFNNSGEIVLKDEIALDEIMEDSGKGDYPHFMLKEIMEERAALNRIIKTYSDNSVFKAFDQDFLAGIEKIEFIGCGTAHHVGLMGARYTELIARIPAGATPASEFIYMDPIIKKNTLYVFVSQSGETADTLRAMELVKGAGCMTVAVTNVLYSSLAKAVDIVCPVCAGPEIAVASTKAYVAQLAVLYSLTRHFQTVKTGEKYDYLGDIKRVADEILNFDTQTINTIAELTKSQRSCIFIGKDMDSITAAEAALKLKEISYIEANSYPSGELKHGFLALVEKGTMVFVFANKPTLNSKTYNAANEAVSRGAKVVLVGANTSAEFLPDFHINLPDMDEFLLSMLAIAPMQYLAYLVSTKKGINPDQPRNLAKSVTVE